MLVLEITNEDAPHLRFDEQSIEAAFAIWQALLKDGIPEGDLSIAFMDDEAHCEVHETFLDDPSSTDVITFCGDPFMDFAGEICINVDVALKKAEELNTPLSEEITLYLAHGLLHLVGLDDQTPEEQIEMRFAEARLLEALRESGKMPSFSIK